MFGVAQAASAQATAATALALGGIDKLLDRVETINLYYGGNPSPSPRSTSSEFRVPWKRSYGVEFGFHVGDYGTLNPRRKMSTPE